MTYTDNFTGFPVDLHPWDGTAPGGRTAPAGVSDGLLADDDGNVWYIIRDGGPVRVSKWCDVRRLAAHLHHLNQILARG